MNCRDLETQLTPYLDGELIAEAQLEVEGHLAGCAACSKMAEVERHNLTLLQQILRNDAPKAPEAFKQRLFETLRADAQRTRRTRVQQLGAMAATVTVAIVAGHHVWKNHQRGLYEQDAAMRHARQFPLEIERSPEEMERWFGGKLDYRVNVPTFPNARAQGARLLQVRDKPAAYIRYDAPKKQMGLFVYGDDHEVDVGTGKEPAVGSSNGYNVVSWREGDVVYQLVTDLDEADIRQLVPETAPAIASPVVTPPTPNLDVRPATLRQ